MSDKSLLRLVHLPPDLAKQLKDSVEEAFQGLGSATAELILHYARRRHHVDMNKLPDGIEELDNALKEILGTGRKMVVNHCAEILTRRLGKEVETKTDRLSDIFRQVVKIYQKRALNEKHEAYLTGRVDSAETSLEGNFVEGLLRD
ncbi:MAG TPA: hypothetical protein VFE98_05370 [Candidatus Bathyarchaeia archaeon]|nr:hypothetical protein [Candidatus Bathyarchaeia archaeon]